MMIFPFNKLGPKLVVSVFWLGGLFLLYSYQANLNLSVNEVSLNLFTVITTSTFGPLLYILTYTIRPITFFPAIVLTILSGVFFGLWGILYTVIGANLSATLAYFIGLFFSQETVTSKSLISSWIELLKKNPFLTIVIMHLTFMPFDVVNYSAGLLRLPFIPYIFGTIIGTLLAIITFVTIGASLKLEEFLKNGITTEAIDTKFIILSIVIFITSLAIAKTFKKQSV